MTPRVVLADDNPALRRVLEDVLTTGGFDVVGVAADGEEAVELALAHRPDAVLLDVRMPKLTGIAATEAIRRELPATRVVLLSAYDDALLQSSGTSAGAVRYLIKGCRAADLLGALRG